MFNNFFSWLRKTIDTLCDRPDHLQRLSIIGSGMAVYVMLWVLVGIIWLGFGKHIELMSQQLSILGIISYGLLGLFGLVVLTVLGTIKGIHIQAPGGVEVGIDTTAGDDDDHHDHHDDHKDK